MQKRREALRVAGWVGVLVGVLAIAIGATAGTDVARMVGAYGMLLVLSGGWAVIGVELLVRHDRRGARVQQAPVPQRGVVSR